VHPVVIQFGENVIPLEQPDTSDTHLWFLCKYSIPGLPAPTALYEQPSDTDMMEEDNTSLW
jgi:hypothetical protein